MGLSDEVYARLLGLRTNLRRFERWSEEQARAAGLTPAQHQLMLAVRGHGDPRGPTIGDVADYLLLRHHSIVGLVDRADAAGLVRRVHDPDDHRVVRLKLTAKGARRLEALSALHVEEVTRLARQLGGERGPEEGASSTGGVSISRVYDAPRGGPGISRVLVDRLWPRGISRESAPVDEWLKDVAPSTGLRRWYGHAPERFDEFARRYGRELRSDAAPAFAELKRHAEAGRLVLVTATRDVDHSAAAVLRDLLEGA